MHDREYTIQDYLFIVIKRKITIIISLIVVTAAAGIYYYTRPHMYLSSSTLIIESKEFGFGEQVPTWLKEETARPVQYYQALMASRVYLNRVAQLIMTDTLLTAEMQPDPEELYELIATGTSLLSSEYTDFIYLTARAEKPELAYVLAVHATEVLKVRCQEIDNEELKNTVDFINEQMAVSRKNLEETERALQEFKNRTNITFSNEDGGMLNEIAQYESELTRVQTELEMTRSNLNSYRQMLRNMLGTSVSDNLITDSPEVVRIRDSIERLETQKNSAPHGSAEESRLVEQIAEERQKLVQFLINSAGGQSALGDEDVKLQSLREKVINLELDLSQLDNRERYYKRLINNFKRDNPNLMQDALEYLRLKRSQTVAENVYTILLEKGEEAKIKMATGSGGLRIVDYPILPQWPLAGNRIRNMMAAVVLGLALGFGLALLQEFLDHNVQTREDVTAQDKLNLLGTIPDMGTPKKQHTGKYLFRRSSKHRSYSENGVFLIDQMKPKTPTVEAYRMLGANLIFTGVDEKIKEVLVTSPNAGEGKTLTTANLAIAWALSGQKVLIVDCDLRKPKQHRLFKLQTNFGLVEHLVKDMPLSMVTHKTPVTNLHLISCGTIPPNPLELISSQKMADFIKEVRHQYDIVMYDSAPVLPVTDTKILATMLQGTLLVFKHDKTPKSSVYQVLEALEKARARIYGAVLNDVANKWGYRYYYRIYFGSYYHSYDYQ
ncbi:polysaccharide biosynthesis tyrosine autokinase [candidate division KSB1 bacterium]|nr:polysaccharide biosynthesis tyrosine autokinase [candidate division KSB1 bacterium]